MSDYTPGEIMEMNARHIKELESFVAEMGMLIDCARKGEPYVGYSYTPSMMAEDRLMLVPRLRRKA